MTHYGTAVIPVAIWIAMAVVGLIVCGWALTDAITDWRLQRRANLVTLIEHGAITPEDEAYEVTARRDVTDELARVVMQGIAFYIGVYALRLQPPHLPISRPDIIISGGLILIESILIGKSLHDRHVRHHVIHTLLKRRADT